MVLVPAEADFVSSFGSGKKLRFLRIRFLNTVYMFWFGAGGGGGRGAVVPGEGADPAASGL